MINSNMDFLVPIVPQPGRGELLDMLNSDSVVEATDGCDVELYEVCEHGYHSWPAYMNLTKERGIK